MLERFPDLRKQINLVDRQLQLAALHRRPDVLADFVEDRADFLDGAGAEGDADVVDAARGVEVEIEIAVGAAEPADIDDEIWLVTKPLLPSVGAGCDAGGATALRPLI